MLHTHTHIHAHTAVLKALSLKLFHKYIDWSFGVAATTTGSTDWGRTRDKHPSTPVDITLRLFCIVKKKKNSPIYPKASQIFIFEVYLTLFFFSSISVVRCSPTAIIAPPQTKNAKRTFTATSKHNRRSPPVVKTFTPVGRSLGHAANLANRRSDTLYRPCSFLRTNSVYSRPPPNKVERNPPPWNPKSWTSFCILRSDQDRRLKTIPCYSSSHPSIALLPLQSYFVTIQSLTVCTLEAWRGLLGPHLFCILWFLFKRQSGAPRKLHSP